MGGTAPPEEGLLVERYGHAVECDGLVDRLGRYGNQSLLIGIPEHKQVAGDAVAEQAGGQAGGVDEVGLVRAHRLEQRLAHGRPGHLGIRVAGELGGGRLMAVDHRMGDLVVELGQGFLAGGDHQVAAEQQVGLAGGDAHGEDVILLGGDADMGHHRAELLRQAGLVEHAAALAFQVRGHAQQRADGGHATAADARQEDVPGARQARLRGLRQRLEQRILAHRLRLAQAAAMHGDEARAEALDAGKILVAGVLVDLALASQLGLQRQHRQAVGLDAAVAAALAHGGVDKGALGRVDQLAALAPASLLGGAGLVIDDHRDALELAQLALHRVQFVAVMESDDGGESGAARVLVRLVADQGDTLDALGEHLLAELVDAQLAVDRLAAGHGHGVVVEDLVGDVDPGGHGRAQSQLAGMEVGAVAQVLENVRGVGERRLADPGGPLAPHLGEGVGVAVHPLGHVVATDAALGAAAFGQLGRGVVRAAGTEVRGAQGAVLGRGQGGFLGREEGQALLDAGAAVDRRQALGDGPGDHRRGQFGQVGQQGIALLVELADHPRALAHRPVVELAGQLVLDDAALLLDHQDLVQPLGELVHGDRLQRPAHADLQYTQADLGAQLLIQAEVFQGLAHVQIGLAGGDDAQARIGRIEQHLVEVVGAGESAGRIDLVGVQALFLNQGWIRPADVNAVLGQLEVLRNLHLDPQRIDLHHRRGIDVLGDGLQRHPATAVARQFPADDAVVEDFLDVGRVEHRNRRGDKGVLALVGDARGLAAMVVAGQQQHAAVLGDAGRVAVLEHVAAAVDTRALAVPHGKHAVIARAGEQVGLLAAPHRGGGQLFVDPGPEVDVVVLKEGLGLPQTLVQVAQGRAAVAGNETGGIQALGAVALLLQHRQSGQRLGAGEVQMTGGKTVLVIQADLGQ